MAKKKRKRFDYAEITRRVEAERAARGITAKALMARVGVDGPRWYRKMKGQGSTFTLDELGMIADAFDAPRGWPFMDWELSRTATELKAFEEIQARQKVKRGPSRQG